MTLIWPLKHTTFASSTGSLHKLPYLEISLFCGHTQLSLTPVSLDKVRLLCTSLPSTKHHAPTSSSLFILKTCYSFQLPHEHQGAEGEEINRQSVPITKVSLPRTVKKLTVLSKAWLVCYGYASSCEDTDWRTGKSRSSCETTVMQGCSLAEMQSHQWTRCQFKGKTPQHPDRLGAIFEGKKASFGVITSKYRRKRWGGRRRIRCVAVGKLNRKCLFDIWLEMSRKQEEFLRKVRAGKT